MGDSTTEPTTENPISPSTTIMLIDEASLGRLRFLHENGVIHGDVDNTAGVLSTLTFTMRTTGADDIATIEANTGYLSFSYNSPMLSMMTPEQFAAEVASNPALYHYVLTTLPGQEYLLDVAMDQPYQGVVMDRNAQDICLSPYASPSSVTPEAEEDLLADILTDNVSMDQLIPFINITDNFTVVDFVDVAHAAFDGLSEAGRARYGNPEELKAAFDRDFSYYNTLYTASQLLNGHSTVEVPLPSWFTPPIYSPSLTPCGQEPVREQPAPAFPSMRA